AGGGTPRRGAAFRGEVGEGRGVAGPARLLCFDYHWGSVPPPRSAACGPAHPAVVAAGRLLSHPGRLWPLERHGTVATPGRGYRPPLDEPPCRTRCRCCAATAG